MRHDDIIIHQHNRSLVIFPELWLILNAMQIIANQLREVNPGSKGMQIGSAKTRINLTEIINAIPIEEIHIDRSIELKLLHNALNKSKQTVILKGNRLIRLE